MANLQNYVWAWALGGLFSLLASIIGFWTVYLHLRYNKTAMCKYEVRILLMVPVYAIEAWFGLIMKEYTLYWDVARESYEALVIYSFYSFLLVYVGGEDQLQAFLAQKATLKRKALANPYVNTKLKIPQRIAAMESTELSDIGYHQDDNGPPEKEEYNKLKDAMHIGDHIFPCNWCMPPYGLANGEFRRKMRMGILQYVPVKVFCAFLTFIFEITGDYHNGKFSATAGYPYVAFITNCSQIWALYCLVLYYHALYELIKPIKPLAKFMSVKLVVFFTFWQSVAISFLIEMSFLHATKSYTDDQFAAGIQDFIITFEMLIAAIAHVIIFPVKEFANAEQLAHGGLATVLNPVDLIKDMHVHIVKPVSSKIKRKVKKTTQVLIIKKETTTTTTQPPDQDMFPLQHSDEADVSTDDEENLVKKIAADPHGYGIATVHERGGYGTTGVRPSTKGQEFDEDPFLAPVDDDVRRVLSSNVPEPFADDHEDGHRKGPLIY